MNRLVEGFEAGLDGFHMSLPTTAQSRTNYKAGPDLCGSLFHFLGKKIYFFFCRRKIGIFQCVMCVSLHDMYRCIFPKPKFCLVSKAGCLQKAPPQLQGEILHKVIKSTESVLAQEVFPTWSLSQSNHVWSFDTKYYYHVPILIQVGQFLKIFIKSFSSLY